MSGASVMRQTHVMLRATPGVKKPFQDDALDMVLNEDVDTLS